ASAIWPSTLSGRCGDAGSKTAWNRWTSRERLAAIPLGFPEICAHQETGRYGLLVNLSLRWMEKLILWCVRKKSVARLDRATTPIWATGNKVSAGDSRRRLS